MHKSTGDKSIAPTIQSYNALLNAWSKSNDENVPIIAERIFAEMLERSATPVQPSGARRPEIRPDAVTITTLIDIHSKSRIGGGIRRCEELFDMMDELQIRRNAYTYSALQTAYARRGGDGDLLDAPQRALKLLDKMLDLHDNRGDALAKPNVVNFNACLHALSRCRSSVNSARTADDLLRRMEMPVEEGGYDIVNRMSYALTILTAARCPDAALAAQLAERNLLRMEERARLEERRREEVSSAAPPSVVLELECFNVVLTAISRSRSADSFVRCLAIVKRMEEYAQQGKENLRPTIRSWNAVVNAIARSPRASDPLVAALAEKIVEDVFSLPTVRPNAFTFAAVLSAYQRSSQPDAERSDALVRRMEEMYENAELESPPDVYHMTILCSTWAKSQHPRAADRCLEILRHMEERSRAGYPGIKPNVRTYNAVLDCLCRSENGDRAEQILYHMMRSYDGGDEDSKPDNFSFNTVIHTFCRSKQRDSGKRAEMILDRFLEFHEDHPDVAPDSRSLSQILTHYCRSREIDAPYRAEYILHRMVELRRSGLEKVEPNVSAFTTVIDTYAYARHPDAGRNAERLVALMKKLAKDFPTLKLLVNTTVMNRCDY
jgi:pentatricopeptide repeat protein